MNSNIDLNQNLADCIHTASGFTSSTHYNICKGTSVVVPYGALDVMAIIFASLIIAAVVGIAARLLWMGIYD